MSELVTQHNKYVTFKSGNEYFALKIECVNEIIVFQEITEIPESEDYIKGLINLRGKIIPVIDVRVRFRQPELPYTDRTCIIVISVKDMVVGLIVEKIAEVVEITEDNILDSPSLGNMDKNQKGENRPFLRPNWRKFATQLGRKFFPVGASIQSISLAADFRFIQNME